MDRDYIQVCAEIAYNDVVITESINNIVLNEGTIIERIKTIASSILTAIKKFFEKIFDFFVGLIDKIKKSAAANKVKQKIAELKAKRSSKQESTSLYNSLMEMVLTEEDDVFIVANDKKSKRGDNFIINYNKIFDHMRSITDPILKASYSCQSQLMNSIIKTFNDEMEMFDLDDENEKENLASADTDEASKKAMEKYRDTLNHFNRIGSYGIKFKYIRINGEDTLDKLDNAISLEYHAASDEYYESKDIDSISKMSSSTMLQYLYSTGLDKYADQVKQMFMDSKKALNETIKTIKDLENKFTSIISKIDPKSESIFGNFLRDSFKQIYIIVSSFEKACVSSARVFGEISVNVISQDMKILSRVM